MQRRRGLRAFHVTRLAQARLLGSRGGCQAQQPCSGGRWGMPPATALVPPRHRGQRPDGASSPLMGPLTRVPVVSDLPEPAASPPSPLPAANYSMPVVSAPSDPSKDRELTFTCTSVNGYPRPNVYWINKTDNSVLDGGLQNHTVSVNAQGLYDVVSVLRVPWAPSINVGCCIENVLLHQNLTNRPAGTVPPGSARGGRPKAVGLW